MKLTMLNGTHSNYCIYLMKFTRKVFMQLQISAIEYRSSNSSVHQQLTCYYCFYATDILHGTALISTPLHKLYAVLLQSHKQAPCLVSMLQTFCMAQLQFQHHYTNCMQHCCSLISKPLAIKGRVWSKHNNKFVTHQPQK